MTLIYTHFNQSGNTTGGELALSYHEIGQNENHSHSELERKVLAELAASGISSDVLAANVQIVPDVAFDPITKEVTGTPLPSALNVPYRRFRYSANPETLGALFIGNDGQCWQAKVFRPMSGLISDAKASGAVDIKTKRTGTYFAPKGIGDKPYIPNIPARQAAAIAESAGLLKEWEQVQAFRLPFWDWVLANPTIPVVTTEGAKKALALISQGILAIAVYGVDCGAKGGQIKPALLPYVAGRPVTIAFDKDTKRTARRRTTQATKRLGRALSAAGCVVSVATWEPSLGKGIDDALVNDAAAAVGAIENPAPFRLWLRNEDRALLEYYRRLPPADQTLNRPFLGTLDFPESARLIALKSPKGTGKTDSLAAEVSAAQRQGIPVIVLTHRTTLAEELARRLGLPYRTELRQYAEGSLLGYVLCIDSLHSQASPPFCPEDWENCLVIIDEAEQFLWHVLNSPTLKKHRSEVLQNLSVLLENCHRCCIADADKSKISLDYYGGLVGESAHLIVNEWRPEIQREATLYETPAALFDHCLNAIADGQKLIIVTGGQEERSTWGTHNLEQDCKEFRPDLKILRIDAKTLAEPGHPAQGCMPRLNEVLPLYDVVICSPSIETGVSIDCQHFDQVICFFTGSHTVNGAAQAAARVRANIPRHIYVAPFSNQNQIGNKATSPGALLNGQNKATQFACNVLRELDLEAFETNFPGHLKTWGTLAAIANFGYQNYQSEVIAKLKEDGYQFTHTVSGQGHSAIKEFAEEIRDREYQAHCEAVSAAPVLEPDQYRALNDKQAKTKEEREAEKKTKLANRYGAENITAELIAADDDGLYPQLRLHYYLSLALESGSPIEATDAKARDAERAADLFPDRRAFGPDLTSSTIAPRVVFLVALGLGQFLDPEATFTNASLADWAAMVTANRYDLRALLGTSFDPSKHSPIEIAQRLLKVLGLKLECFDRHRVDGVITRFYRLAAPADPIDRPALFKRWRDQGICDSTPIKKDLYLPANVTAA